MACSPLLRLVVGHRGSALATYALRWSECSLLYASIFFVDYVSLILEDMEHDHLHCSCCDAVVHPYFKVRRTLCTRQAPRFTMIEYVNRRWVFYYFVR